MKHLLTVIISMMTCALFAQDQFEFTPNYQISFNSNGIVTAERPTDIVKFEKEGNTLVYYYGVYDTPIFIEFDKEVIIDDDSKVVVYSNKLDKMKVVIGTLSGEVADITLIQQNGSVLFTIKKQ